MISSRKAGIMDSTLIRAIIISALIAVMIGLYFIFSERGRAIISGMKNMFMFA